MEQRDDDDEEEEEEDDDGHGQKGEVNRLLDRHFGQYEAAQATEPEIAWHPNPNPNPKPNPNPNPNQAAEPEIAWHLNWTMAHDGTPLGLTARLP